MGRTKGAAAIRKLVKDGVEWVKTYPTGDAAAPDTNDHHTLCMTFEEMHAVVAEAHNHRMKVTGHCRDRRDQERAAAGYDTLEHGTFMDTEALDMLLGTIRLSCQPCSSNLPASSAVPSSNCRRP